MNQEQINEIRRVWLTQCGACDAGLPMSCSHPEEDYRPVMLELVNELERLIRERDAYKKAKAENDERFMRERDAARAELDKPVRVVVVLDTRRGRVHSITTSDEGARQHVRELVAKYDGDNLAATMTVDVAYPGAATPQADDDHPYIWTTPARLGGVPCIGGHRLSADQIASIAVDGVAAVQAAYPWLTRAQVLVACWHAAVYGEMCRWSEWARKHESAMWAGRWDEVPEPPNVAASQADELPGMWEAADITGGQTDAVPGDGEQAATTKPAYFNVIKASQGENPWS